MTGEQRRRGAQQGLRPRAGATQRGSLCWVGGGLQLEVQLCPAEAVGGDGGDELDRCAGDGHELDAQGPGGVGDHGGSGYTE